MGDWKKIQETSSPTNKRTGLGEYQKILDRIYHNPGHPGSFGGAKRLFLYAKEAIPGLTIEDVREWLRGEPDYTNFVIPKTRFRKIPILVDRVDEQWQMDTMDMSYYSRWNKNIVYLLIIIDCLSRYAWVVPIASKKAVDVIKGLNRVLKLGRKPEKIQTDQGTEFKNDEFKTYLRNKNIIFFTTTDNAVKCAIVERFIRTLRSRLFRYMYYKNSHEYINELPRIVDAYNQSYHRTIGISPKEVNKENQHEVVIHIQKDLRKRRPKNLTPKFKVGDHVRLQFGDVKGDKGTLPRWTEEVFKVRRIVKTPERLVYKVEDLKGEDITSIFYQEELQKVHFDPKKVYKVDQILKSRINPITREREYLVHWYRWNKKFNSWTPKPFRFGINGI